MVATQLFHAPVYSYDSLGRRIESISDARGFTKRCYLAGQRVIEEYDAAGTPARQRYYVWGNYIDELLMFNDDAGDDSDYVVCHDQLYSAHALLSKGDGAIVERYNYYAYGLPLIYINDGGDGDWWDGDETYASTSAKGLVYLFTGREFERFSGSSVYLQYSRARYYNPGLQRWMQRDPIGYFDGMSLYEYVRSRPIVNMDPMGTSDLFNPGLLNPTGPGNNIGNVLYPPPEPECEDNRPCNYAVGISVWLQMVLMDVDHKNDFNGGNAIRHCMAACRSNKVCKGAKEFWDGLEDGKKQSSKMDLANNKVGYGLSKKSSCLDACDKALRDGKLTCLKSENDTTLVLCPKTYTPRKSSHFCKTCGT